MQWSIVIAGLCILFRWRVISSRNIKMVADFIVYIGVYIEALLFRRHSVESVSQVAKQVSKFNPLKVIKKIRTTFANRFNVTWHWKDPKVVGGTFKFSIAVSKL